MIRNDLSFYSRIHAAVYAPDALHETDGVPMKIVID